MILRPDKWLFICSANIARSPTAEYLARKRGLIARSCGTAGRPRTETGMVVTPLTCEIVCWADVIVCMKEGHRLALETLHPFSARPNHEKKIFVWGLSDDWGVPYHPEMMAKIEPLLDDSIRQYVQWLEERTGRCSSDTEGHGI